MPDTKSGREKKGRNKRRQLESQLYKRELEALQTDPSAPTMDDLDGGVDSEFLVDPDEAEDVR